MTDSPQRLNSWKEIAAHLRHDVRTVRRWETGRGLPVHRIPGGGSVFAFTDEIDRWLARDPRAQMDVEPGSPEGPDRTPDRRAPRFRVVAAVGSLVVVALLVAIVVYVGRTSRTGPVRRLAVTPRGLKALDENGRTRWEYSLNTSVTAAPQGWAYVGPPDASSDQVLIAGVDTVSPDGAMDAVLAAFHADGRERWRVKLHDKYRFSSGEYGPSWTSYGSALKPFTLDGDLRFAWTVHHQTWWPSFVVVFDTRGVIRDRFFNSGWITGLEIVADGRMLLARGVSNSADASIVAVLDVRHLSGASPEPEGSAYECQNCPAGRPHRYLVFGRSALSRATSLRLSAPEFRAVDDRYEVRVSEGTELPLPETIYDFSQAFKLLRATRSSLYWEWWRKLEGKGAVQRAATSDADRPTVRMWSAEAGWTVESAAFPSAVDGAPPVR